MNERMLRMYRNEPNGPFRFAERITPKRFVDFVGAPFGALPRNTIHDEPFETVEDDSLAYVAMELGLHGMDPLTVLMAAEAGDLETLRRGLELDPDDPEDKAGASPLGRKSVIHALRKFYDGEQPPSTKARVQEWVRRDVKAGKVTPSPVRPGTLTLHGII